MKCHRNERAKECSGGTHLKHTAREPHVASIARMPNHATTGLVAAISALIYRWVKISIGPLKPRTGSFSNPEEGLAVVDTISPAITAIIKGWELSSTVVDGGSGVNGISLRTCNTLGIQDHAHSGSG